MLAPCALSFGCSRERDISNWVALAARSPLVPRRAPMTSSGAGSRREVIWQRRDPPQLRTAGIGHRLSSMAGSSSTNRRLGGSFCSSAAGTSGRTRFGRRGFAASAYLSFTNPALTGRVRPVIQRAASDAGRATALAMSSGCGTCTGSARLIPDGASVAVAVWASHPPGVRIVAHRRVAMSNRPDGYGPGATASVSGW